MRYTVILRVEALEEAEQAACYIADQGFPETAVRWFADFQLAIGSLAKMPRRCSYARENGALAGVEFRQLLFKSHRIIFTIRQDQVHVLHVRYVAQSNIGALPADETNPL